LKILYFDMDNVLVDFQSAFKHFSTEILAEYENNKDDIPGLFSKMEPMPGALEAYQYLVKKYDTYILSTAPWNNPSAWVDKLHWVKNYLGEPAYKRLILSHNKHLNAGDYLIDDRTANGAAEFKGEHIQFGSDKFPDWVTVVRYLDS